jgi:6-phosphogluconolactonase (cycloisomerase 2 family)
MRISPKKLMQGLLYLIPITLLTLTACGGGGSTTPGAPVLITYTIGGAVSGLTGTGLILRNNGGDDLTVAASSVSYTFATAVASNGSYNVTVLTNPGSPTQVCAVANATGTASANVTTANVSCANAYTIGGTISGTPPGTGLILQNNGVDNLLVPAGATSFTFSTPLAANLSSTAYNVTVLASPNGQTCTPAASSSGSVTANVTSATINCVNNATPPPPDRFVYTANYDATSISAFTAPASGVPSTAIGTPEIVEANPSSIAVDPAGLFAYVTNYGANDIRVSSIDTSTGALAHIDADGGIAGFQDSITTGSGPIAIAIHPSGKFAYAVNQLSNSVSGYSIDPLGALSRIDLNGSASGTTVPTRTSPVSIAITPDGNYAYVVNAAETSCAIAHCGSISSYSIDTTTGALTSLGHIEAGTTSYAIAVDPSGQYAYVANGAGGVTSQGDVWVYAIAPTGTLSKSSTATAGTGPRAVATDPSGKYVYVVNGGSNDISAYTIGGSGALTPIDCSSSYPGAVCSSNNFAAGTGPIAISIDSSGQNVYVANSTNSTVSAYSINGSGALIPLGSAINTGTSPHSVTTAR